MTSEYLEEFEKLNTTTDSIYDLEDCEVLIILSDGTNLPVGMMLNGSIVWGQNIMMM